MSGCEFTLEELRHDKPREECGVVGVFNHPEAANLAYLSLYAQQHRGQEGAGIVSYNAEDDEFHTIKGQGLVPDIFSHAKLQKLPGNFAIGHNRYSTAGGAGLKNVQPLVAKSALGTIAMAHNGNLTNADLLREQLEEQGAIFQSSIDSEVLLHLIARSREKSFPRRIIDAIAQVKGGFSLIFLTEDSLVGVRDPHGFRPLSLGRFLDGGYVLASETCAFDLIGAEFERDIRPGEMVVINGSEVSSCMPFQIHEGAFCIFEYVYFSRVDSKIGGNTVWTVRKNQGRFLARETPVEADVVIPVPDSGVATAMGFAEESGIPYEMGLIRNHYVGRTFIEPQSSIRHFGVKIKLNPVREVIEGKRVVVVDDSIVRGTTSRKIVEMIRRAGAREVHMRIGSPKIISPCFYGIDTPTREELIGSSNNVEEIRQHLTADTLGYLSEEGLLAASPKLGGYCTACFSGNYPVNVVFDKPEQGGLFQGG
ncbi:MAG: amidophosphoribosyltransferase [Nitrospirota bacterium]|nr:amidophosphoribosyltransferase [Nitrospirota bacterium]